MCIILKLIMYVIIDLEIKDYIFGMAFNLHVWSFP